MGQMGTYKRSHKGTNMHGNGIGNSEVWSLEPGSEIRSNKRTGQEAGKQIWMVFYESRVEK